MTALLRPWTARILTLLAEGEMERERLIELTIPYVSQGHAYRKREQQRAHSNRRSVPISGRRVGPRRLPETERFRIGARLVVASTLRSLIRRGSIVRSGTRYRLPVRSAGTEPSARESA